MCGIAGFIDRSIAGPEAKARLERMLDSIVHRGPDGAGTYLSEKTGLAMGMRRLSIIDLAGGRQPIWNEDRTLCVVFNGEIYNYVELTKELVAAGHRFETRTDTEVLVHLFEARGTAMLDKLRGMFAFALLDTRRNELFLARDHFGQKPLYYFAGNDRFAFGSELKCVLPEAAPDIDPEAFLDYISWFSLPPPRTHFKQIFKLPAGNCMTVPLERPDEIAIRKFWSYDLETPAELHDMDEAVAQLDGMLHESIHIHLRADVPIGVLLSSGLDSRCVAAYAQEIQGGRLSTFSVGFAGKDSELEGAARTACEIGSRHFAIELDAADFSSSIDRIVSHLDEPIGDAAAFAVLKVCELAREHVKVLLSGEGADELFAGYAGRYSGMMHTLERSERMRRFASVLPEPKNFSSPSRWERLLARAHASRGAEAIGLRIEGFPGDVRNPRGLRAEQLRRLLEREESFAGNLYRPQRDLLSEMLVLDIEWQLAESLLQKADKMSMGASIELRTPFLDIGVAKLAARIGSNLKLPPNGPGKLVLRKCLARRVPEGIDRPKKGFPVPLASWFAGPLRSRIEDEVFSPNAACMTWLDRALLRRAWDDFLGGRWDGARVFYALLLYEVWRGNAASAFGSQPDTGI